MIETVYVHVCFVCACLCVLNGRETYVITSGRTAPPWLPAICSQAPHFQMDFRRLLFYHISSGTAPPADHIDRAPSFSPLSLDLCLSHPKSTEWGVSMQSFAIFCRGLRRTKATAGGN